MAGKRKLGGWLFLGLVSMLYGATALVEPDPAQQAFASFLTLFGKLIPVLGFVFVLMFMGELFLSPQRVEGWLGRRSGLSGWLLALAAGVLSSGPVYAWYVLLAELRAKGMRTALVAVVLQARAIKLPLLPMLAHYFGWSYIVALSLCIAAFSIFIGLIMELLERPAESK